MLKLHTLKQTQWKPSARSEPSHEALPLLRRHRSQTWHGSCVYALHVLRFRSGLTAEVALKLGRGSVLIELNPKYVEMQRERLAKYPILTAGADERGRTMTPEERKQWSDKVSRYDQIQHEINKLQSAKDAVMRKDTAFLVLRDGLICYLEHKHPRFEEVIKPFNQPCCGDVLQGLGEDVLGAAVGWIADEIAKRIEEQKQL